MKLTPIEKKIVPTSRGRAEEYRELLKEFVDSDMQTARVDEIGALKVETLYAGLKNVVGKGAYPVRVVKAQRSIYLVRI